MDEQTLRKLAEWTGGKASRATRPPPAAAVTLPPAAIPPRAEPPAPERSRSSFAHVPRRAIHGTGHFDLLSADSREVPDERFFSVGLDAGTSGLRVAVNDEFQARTTLFDFGPNRAGGTRFSFPAVAGVADGRLHLGNDAVALPPRVRLASFKGAMIHRDADLRFGELWSAQRLPYAAELTSGDGATVADFLYTVTLARAMELALPVLVTGGTPAHLTFTVGAPLNRDMSLSRRFERALTAALLLSGTIGALPGVAGLIERFASAWDNAQPFMGAKPSDRRLWVRSEVHAAILPLRRVFELGRNLLVADIGASTTDIAVVRIGTEQKPHCYASLSAPIGVDTLDLAELAGAGGGDADVVTLRQRRSAGANARPVPARQREAQRLRALVDRTLAQGMEKNPDAGSWSTMYVVTVGGGSRVPELRQFVQGAQARGWVRTRHQPGLALEKPAVKGHSIRPPTSAEEYEIVSVLGSAVPVWEAGEFVTADRVAITIPTHDSGELNIRRRHAQWV